MQNFIKLSAAVYELSCPQSNKKISDDAENNTALTSAGKKKFAVLLCSVKLLCNSGSTEAGHPTAPSHSQASGGHCNTVGQWSLNGHQSGRPENAVR